MILKKNKYNNYLYVRVILIKLLKITINLFISRFINLSFILYYKEISLNDFLLL